MQMTDCNRTQSQLTTRGENTRRIGTENNIEPISTNDTCILYNFLQHSLSRAISHFDSEV